MSNYKVYCLTNTITGEKYIGVTKQKMYDRLKAGKGYKPTTKINQAILKYGWVNFKYNILFETKNKEIAGMVEEGFIKKYDTVRKGYNIQSGGFKGFTQIVTEKQKRNMSLAQKGRHYSPKTEFKKGEYHENSKNKKVPVLCVELNKVFKSIKDAEKELNLFHIWDCLHGKRNQCGGYHWQLVKEEE